MTVQMITHKILNCRKEPDAQGDIVPAGSINYGDTVSIHLETSDDPKNFIVFGKPEVRADGLYITAPAPSLRPYDGMFLAPEGSVTRMTHVKHEGQTCRLIKHLILTGVSIVPRHVDPDIKPLRIEDTPVESSSKKARTKITVKPGKRRVRGADNSPGKKKVFKRRRVGRREDAR